MVTFLMLCLWKVECVNKVSTSCSLINLYIARGILLQAIELNCMFDHHVNTD